METWLWILLVGLALVVIMAIWAIQRGRRARSARLRESVAGRPGPTVPAQPTEDLVEKALRQREEELALRPRTVELDPAPLPRPATPPNPRAVKLDEPPLEIETQHAEPGVSRVQRMAEEQWEGLHVVGPAARTKPPAPVAKKESPEFEPSAPAKKRMADPSLGWDDVEIRKDRRND